MDAPRPQAFRFPDSAEPTRPILWVRDRILTVAEFMHDVERMAAALPSGTHLVNICESRLGFLVAYSAALARGHTNLMPPSRAPQALEEAQASFGGSYRCDDDCVARALAPRSVPPPAGASLRVPGEHIAQIAFTSGSTGLPRAHMKRWDQLMGSTRFNAARIRECLAPRYGAARPWIVATVPAQHMYGTEMSVLLPLAADMAVHSGRPLFPAEVGAALADVPAPRVLVTTPVHLRALVESGLRYPEIGVVISATAPLDRALAQAVERALATTVLEMFGSTETCVIAARLTAREEHWTLYPGVTLTPGPECAAVDAPWFATPTTLSDVVELVPPDRFLVRGRNIDMVEVAGKRASLADLTRRLLGIPGVKDAVAFQPDADEAPVRRVAALVVAPGLSLETITTQLSRSVDPVFMPRPLVLVPALPRNELGKVSREALLRLATPHLDPTP
ncbi:MAG TPA: AMP-binding protein [Steroidobacteraceae bacterium]|nr:AMP-binding protein [Steroidobacteraceae bacterium]